MKSAMVVLLLSLSINFSLIAMEGEKSEEGRPIKLPDSTEINTPTITKLSKTQKRNARRRKVQRRRQLQAIHLESAEEAEKRKEVIRTFIADLQKLDWNKLENVVTAIETSVTAAEGEGCILF